MAETISIKLREQSPEYVAYSEIAIPLIYFIFILYTLFITLSSIIYGYIEIILYIIVVLATYQKQSLSVAY